MTPPKGSDREGGREVKAITPHVPAGLDYLVTSFLPEYSILCVLSHPSYFLRCSVYRGGITLYMTVHVSPVTCKKVSYANIPTHMASG